MNDALLLASKGSESVQRQAAESLDNAWTTMMKLFS